MFQAMERTGRCVAVSVPNSPNIVSAKYRKSGDSPEIRRLARDVIRWECRPYPTMEPPPLAYFIKIAGLSATALPLFRQHHLLFVVQSASFSRPLGKLAASAIIFCHIISKKTF